MTDSEQDEPVAYRVCNVDEAGQGRPLPDDPRFHEAMDQVARAAVRLAKADRERQFQEFLAAWLAGRQATIVAALEALPAGMAPATQAANVHAALLAEADQPGTPVRIQWAVQLPGHPFGLRIAGGETEAREALADQRAEHRPSDGPAPELIRRLVGDWQPVDGAQ